MDDVAEHHLVNLVATDTRTLLSLPGHQRPQLRRGEVFQTAAEIPDSGTHSTDHNHFTIRHDLLPSIYMQSS
ncbi:hypothetical protein D3C78_1017460 [compost metagenome]